MSEKWTLHIGCHRGTVTSRDQTKVEYGSEKAAREAMAAKIRFWRRIGYSLWFAKIYDPDGKLVYNNNGVPYR